MGWRIALGLAAVVAIVVGLLAAGAALTLRPWDDEPDDPDAVVVLGGAGQERTELGIELRDRYDALLVLSSSAQFFGEELGLDCGRDALCIDPEPETTIGEARTVASLAEERGWGHVTVATSEFHTGRARVLFRQCLGDRVSVVGAPRPDGGTVSRSRRLQEVVATSAALVTHRACWWR